MKMNLNGVTANEIYEVVVEKIYQIPSVLVLSDWQEVNMEFHGFIKEVGTHKLFVGPLRVLNSILLFGIAEDYELGYSVALPFFSDVKDKKGIDSIWELKLFTRIAFLLCRNFADFKELSNYAFDFLEESYQDKYDSIEVKSVLIVSFMYALVKMNARDFSGHKDEIKEIFKNLLSELMIMGEKYHIELYTDTAHFLNEELKNKKEIDPATELDEVKERYIECSDALNKLRTEFGHKYKIEDLYSIFSKSTSGGKLWLLY